MNRRFILAGAAALAGDTGGLPFPQTLNNLTAWYDAQAVTPQADNTGLATWPDETGNGFNLAGTNDPKYRTASFNSLPCIDFNNSEYYQVDASWADLSQPFTIVLVGIWDVNSTSDRFLWGVVNTVGINATAAAGAIGISAGNSEQAGVPGVGTPFRLITSFNGASSIGEFNGTPFQVGTLDPGANALDDFQVGAQGGSNTLDGKIAELIIYSDALNEAEQAAMDAYLVTKWGF